MAVYFFVPTTSALCKFEMSDESTMLLQVVRAPIPGRLRPSPTLVRRLCARSRAFYSSQRNRVAKWRNLCGLNECKTATVDFGAQRPSSFSLVDSAHDHSWNMTPPNRNGPFGVCSVCLQSVFVYLANCSRRLNASSHRFARKRPTFCRPKIASRCDSALTAF